MVMPTRKSKYVLMEALAAAEIEIASTATLAELQQLYNNNILRADVTNEDTAESLNETALESTAIFSLFTPAAIDLTGLTSVSYDASGAVHPVTHFTAEPDAAAVANYIAAQAATSARASILLPANDVTDAITAEIKYLKKEQELLELKRQIRNLQQELQPVSAARRYRADFNDIEHALPKFSGETEDTMCFFRYFEEIMNLADADETFHFLSLRRTFTGAARTLVEMSLALNFEDLKKAVVQESGHSVTAQTIYLQLRDRKWDHKNESMHRYVLSMQNGRRTMEYFFDLAGHY